MMLIRSMLMVPRRLCECSEAKRASERVDEQRGR